LFRQLARFGHRWFTPGAIYQSLRLFDRTLRRCVQHPVELSRSHELLEMRIQFFDTLKVPFFGQLADHLVGLLQIDRRQADAHTRRWQGHLCHLFRRGFGRLEFVAHVDLRETIMIALKVFVASRCRYQSGVFASGCLTRGERRIKL
jgi:hypothetical protein